jgi:hypothetical protein
MKLFLNPLVPKRLSWVIGLTLAASVIAAGPVRADPPRSACLAAHADAQMLRRKGSLLAAHEKLMVCAQEGCPGPVANDCATWLGEVEASLSSVVFAVSDASGQDVIDTHVYANGQLISERADGRAIAIDPGTYTFRFEAPPRAAIEETVSIRQSEKNRIVRVEFPAPAPEARGQMTLPASTQAPEPPRSRGIPTGTWVLGGVALAGTAAFVTFAVLGHDKYNDAKKCRTDARCKNLDELIDTGKRDYVVANIALGVGVASAAAALIVYLVDSSSAPKPARLPPLQLETDFANRAALLGYRASF